jgi:hypothetical protein
LVGYVPIVGNAEVSKLRQVTEGVILESDNVAVANVQVYQLRQMPKIATVNCFGEDLKL